LSICANRDSESCWACAFENGAVVAKARIARSRMRRCLFIAVGMMNGFFIFLQLSILHHLLILVGVQK